MTGQISYADLEALCLRAIDDPGSISRANSNRIYGIPAPEEEDRLCVAATGSTRAQLYTKALNNPSNLTLAEARIVAHPAGVCFEEARAARARDAAAAPPLRALRDNAIRLLQTAEDEETATARQNAGQRRRELEDAAVAESQRRFDEWNAAQRLDQGTPWIKLMLRNGLFDSEAGADYWGFVVFRTGAYGVGEDALWRRFREYFDKAAEAMILHWNSGPLLWPQFHCVFVEGEELDGNSNEQLRERFRKMRDGDGQDGHFRLSKGIRTNCFLVVDQAAIESDAVKNGFVARNDYLAPPSINIRPDDPVVYIRAVNPDHKAPENKGEVDQESGEVGMQSGKTDQGERRDGETGPGDEKGASKGQATVALPRVFDWLHYVCFQAECGSNWHGTAVVRGWGEIYQQTKVPEAWVRDQASNSGSVVYI